MKRPRNFRELLTRLHQDEAGAVSIETILIVAAIALPILIFLLKIAWPRIKTYFTTGMDSLEAEGQNAQN